MEDVCAVRRLETSESQVGWQHPSSWAWIQVSHLRREGALPPITLGLKNCGWNEPHLKLSFLRTNYFMKFSVLWSFSCLLHNEDFSQRAPRPMQPTTGNGSQFPLTKPLCCGDPECLQAWSLEICIALILTWAVMVPSVLCVLIRCYYLLPCPEAMSQEWVRFHKSTWHSHWRSTDSSHHITVIISLRSIRKLWWCHHLQKETPFHLSPTNPFSKSQTPHYKTELYVVFSQLLQPPLSKPPLWASIVFGGDGFCQALAILIFIPFGCLVYTAACY